MDRKIRNRDIYVMKAIMPEIRTPGEYRDDTIVKRCRPDPENVKVKTPGHETTKSPRGRGKGNSHKEKVRYRVMY